MSDNLGGKNTGRRSGCARSSRARSALFRKLRDLDRRIGFLDLYIKAACSYPRFDSMIRTQKQRDKLDQKRKETRQLIKYGEIKV